MNLRRSKSGQILVEYMLLMVISVSCASLLIKGLVGRGEGTNQGIIVKQWDKILKVIGNDLPDCSRQTDFSKPNCPP